MSIWTHVAAIVRVDDLRLDDNSNKDFTKIFGKECSWDTGDFNDAFENPDKYLPMGSEGSLDMSVWIEPNTSCVAAYTVSIFGDLRDYSSPDKIIEWFKEKCKKVWVRQATITVETEGYKTVTWTYGDEENA